jgi:hypothetical protein
VSCCRAREKKKRDASVGDTGSLEGPDGDLVLVCRDKKFGRKKNDGRVIRLPQQARIGKSYA